MVGAVGFRKVGQVAVGEGAHDGDATQNGKACWAGRSQRAVGAADWDEEEREKDEKEEEGPRVVVC